MLQYFFTNASIKIRPTPLKLVIGLICFPIDLYFKVNAHNSIPITESFISTFILLTSTFII